MYRYKVDTIEEDQYTPDIYVIEEIPYDVVSGIVILYYEKGR